jgi:cardiolipin synthase
MKKIGLAAGLALAMAALVLFWGSWGGARMARGASPPGKPLAQASLGDVVINEVGWMGTQANGSDEWIELYNTTDQPIDLSGWTLTAADGTPSIALSGTIPARGYFLLERTDDNAVSNLAADLVYGNDGTTWALKNTGETLELRDASDALIDAANGDGGGWPAGDNPTKATMERIDPTTPDADTNWATNDGLTRNGLDANSDPINGTPKAQNSAYAAPGLAVTKTGPQVVTPGFDFASHIALSNTGASLITGVIVTDVLPLGLSFVSQTSSFTFAQPATDTLVWQVGQLPSDALRLITFTLRPAETLTSTVTNVVTATDDTGRGETALWSAPVVPYVRLYALHPHALRSGDEAVALINLSASTAMLSGWGLSDGDATPDATLPSVALAPNSILWLTENADDFRHVFGFDADIVLDTDWPGFTNDGEEALLFDDGGNLVDTLVYGSGVTTTAGWSGPAVPYPRSGFGPGQVLYRKLDQVSGLPVPDTDAAADWAQATDDDVNGRKVRFPGWDLEEFFFPAQVTQTAALSVWVAPDGLYEGIAAELQKAQSSILIEGYTFESAELAGVITNLLTLRPSLAVTVLLEGQPAFGLDDQELWACGQMADAGASIYFMHNDSQAKIYDRYDFQHAKFIIVDGSTVLVGSENLSSGGMPADPKADGTWGHRGVFLATDAPDVVTRAQAILGRDLDITHSDIVPWGTYSYTAPSAFTPTYTPNFVTYTARFSQSLALDGTFAFEVIQSPENSLRDRDALLGLLGRAGSGDTILIEQLYEHQSWDGNVNPRLKACMAAARAGATVRLLLDSRYDDGSNQATADYINGLAQSEALDLEARLGNPTGEGIHNKMVLAWIGGQGWVHVGSINGSEASSKVNRELALQVQSDEAYDFLKDVFDHDWQASWQSAPGVTHVYLPLVARNYVPPADHLVISELLYDPVGVPDADGEWIEIYNPTGITVTLTGYVLSDGGSYGDGRASFPLGSSLGPEGVIVVAQKASGVGFVPDYELKESDPTVPNLVPVSEGISWGNSGDEAILRDATGAAVDVVVYGNGSYSGVTPHPGVGWGHSLERKPADRDTDDCSTDFWERYTPDPGQVTLD